MLQMNLRTSPLFDARSVFQDWYLDLPMQQQSVLILACRGPDGVAKGDDAIKDIVTRYRATVLNAAYLGRAMRIDEGDNTTFMTLLNFSDEMDWYKKIKAYFKSVDRVPHHAHLHLMHGAQIIGYKHPNSTFQNRWYDFYLAGCMDMHVGVEPESVMDLRLSDWHREHWDDKT